MTCSTHLLLPPYQEIKSVARITDALPPPLQVSGQRLAGFGPCFDGIIQKTASAILAHPLFRAAANPKQLVKVMLSRYKPGMAYGTHVDNALMGGVRTDLSFTLFLKEPDSYEGGALVIEGNDGDNEIKLPAGSLVLYTHTLYHVPALGRKVA